MQSRQTVLTSRSGLVNGMFHDSCSCALFHNKLDVVLYHVKINMMNKTPKV